MKSRSCDRIDFAGDVIGASLFLIKNTNNVAGLVALRLIARSKPRHRGACTQMANNGSLHLVHLCVLNLKPLRGEPSRRLVLRSTNGESDAIGVAILRRIFVS